MTRITVASAVLSAFVLSSAGFAEPVFNGKDLEGWIVKPESPAVWRVVKDRVQLVEVIYVGTHEKAPY